MYEPTRKMLEEKGLDLVLKEISEGKSGYGCAGSPLREEINAWIYAKRHEKENEAASRSEERDKQALDIATQALQRAHWANWIAIIAIIISVVVALIG